MFCLRLARLRSITIVNLRTNQCAYLIQRSSCSSCCSAVVHVRLLRDGVACNVHIGAPPSRMLPRHKASCNSRRARNLWLHRHAVL